MNAFKMTLHNHLPIGGMAKGWQKDLIHSFKSLEHLIILEGYSGVYLRALRGKLIWLQVINVVMTTIDVDGGSFYR